MDKTPPFIKSIQINKVRHLRDILIHIDDMQPRHLILTGPNGCGKTSLLCSLKDYLEGIPNNQLVQVATWKNGIKSNEGNIKYLETRLVSSSSEEEKVDIQFQVSNAYRVIKDISSLVAQYESVIPNISDLAELIDAYHKGEFLLAFFEARRVSQIQPVQGAQKLDLPKVNPISVNPQSQGCRFLQYLVNQKNRSALLALKKDQAGVDEIERWMDKITGKFRELFEDENLTLEYDIDNFDFTINIPGREPFRLVDNQLSDGFSSVIHIVAELLLRMEAVTAGNYNVPGIVLIDEIETHLHIRLQKAILPFLTDFFPNIQFIVTTHSPFVLTSLNDAVVFDLESQERMEHMAPMAASTVVESYFDQDLYSNEIKNLVARYSNLAKKTERTDEENEEIIRLRSELDGIEYKDAPELVAHFHTLRAKESAQ